jgi:hypothetical protein
MLENSAQLVASQEGLRSMELVSSLVLGLWFVFKNPSFITNDITLDDISVMKIGINFASISLFNHDAAFQNHFCMMVQV